MDSTKHNHANINLGAKHILLLIGLLIATMSFGQVQTQKGVSYRYNGKNPRTPLPNVTIECVTANNTAISDSTGSFTLVFNKLKMGDRVGLVTVKKREMMVFNQHAVDEWSIRKEPFCLILCDANEFDRQKQELIAIGKREAQKKYDRQKADLEQLLEASQIDRARYEAELDTAWQELDRLHKHIDEYADLFARIDESEIDSLAQRAMDLFNQGQVDEAVRLFEQGQYLEKLKNAKAIKKQARELKAKIEDAETQATHDSIEAIQSLNAQIAAYKLQNEWQKAGTLLKGLVDELETYELCFEYVSFCLNQKDYNEAEIYCQKAITLIRQLAQNNPQVYKLDLAGALSNLALLYSKTQRLSESESLYLEALEIIKDNQQEDIKSYYGAIMLNNLASLYKDTQRYTESETLYLKALKLRRQLSENYSKSFEPDLAGTLNNLALLYSDTQRSKESEEMFLETLEIYRRLTQDNPQTYEPYVATTLNNLAILYSDIQRPKESEEMFLEALKIRRQLAQDNPQAFESSVATTLNDLANLYTKAQRFKESETMYLESLKIRNRLATDNPQAYEPALSSTLNDLAIFYSKTDRLTESETYYNMSLEIIRRLVKNNPQAYELNLARSLYGIGFLQYRKEQYSKAISSFEEALGLVRTLASNNPTYIQYCHFLLYGLSELYWIVKDYTKHFEVNEEWLPILKQYYQEDEKNWQEEYSGVLGNQSFYYILRKQFNQAEQYAKEALLIDNSKTFVYSNLAAALLFLGKYNEAEQIYSQHKAELKDSFLQDLNDFEAAGIIPEERKADVEKIRKMLSE